MKKSLFAFAFISILFLSLSVFADQEIAFQQYHQGEYEKAKMALEDLANKKNATALYYLANMKLYGFGVTKNPESGLELMTQSANLNYLPAELYLGKYYLQQKQDLTNALFWLQKAADQGNADAETFTALCYLHGFCGKKNPELARKYIIKAAQNGIPMAQYELATLFLNSKYESDRKMGKIWMMKAAKNNYPDAAAAIEDDEKKQPSKLINTSDEIAKNKEITGELTPKQHWNSMMEMLKKAKITLINPPVITAENGSITATPKIIPFSKSLVVKPHYDLLSPTQIPIEYIIAITIKENYNKQKMQINPITYDFTLPIGATTNEIAFNLLRRQAEYGHVQAIFKLGQMYEKGLVVQKNEKKAFDLFMEAAKRDYVKAEYMVGLYYYKEMAPQKDDKEAFKWLNQAALHGSAAAQFLLGNIAESESNKNFDQAIGMYNLAAQNGVSQAQYRLAELYVMKSINPNRVFTLNKQDFKTAFHLFKKAADNGLKKADLDLAYFYATQSTSEKQQEYAYKIAKTLSDKDNKKALLLLAILYDRGIGTDQDTSDAVSIYKKLIGQQNGLAEFMLGSYYYQKDKDDKRAIEYLKIAAQQDNPYAFYNLAIIAKNNDRTPNHNSEFVSLLMKSSSFGYAKADILLADYYLLNGEDRNTLEKAVKIYQKLANENNATAQLKLGMMYQSGLYFPKNDEQARLWYEKSAEQNNAIAEYLLGYFYQTGIEVTRDLRKAQQYYLSSAKKNYVPALVALGYTYEVDEHNYTQAAKYYEAADKLNSAQAKYNLGLMYQYGKGVEVDKDKAEELFKESQQLQHPQL